MLIIKLVGAALLGALLGMVFLPLAVYPLLLAAEGGRDMNGGIAMGMVTGVAPLGAVLGAIAGAALVLVRGRRTPDTTRPDAGRGLKTLGIIGVVVIGYFALLLYLQGPAKIRFDQSAGVEVELRSPVNAVTRDGTFKPHADLYDHYTKKVIPVPLSLRVEGGNAILKGTYQYREGLQRSRFRAHLAPDLTLSATVPAYPGEEKAPGYGGWSKVNSIANPQTGKSELAFAQEAHMYRYRMIPKAEK